MPLDPRALSGCALAVLGLSSCNSGGTTAATYAWASLVKQLEIATHQRGLRFGIIYIGDEFDMSDPEWTGKVVARFQSYQGSSNGGSPDYVLYQSWEPHPHLCLPESDPTPFTGAIAAYVKATT
jgi:hypothetical protein